MSKNLIHEYEGGMEDDLMENIFEENSSMKMKAKNKMGGSRVDMKRTRTSYIAKGKKAAKKSIDTSKIEDLNRSICGKKKRK